MTKTPLSHKFLQSIDDDYYYLLGKAAKTRGVTVQELVRAVIIPDWISKAKKNANLGTVEAPTARSRVVLPRQPKLDTRS